MRVDITDRKALSALSPTAVSAYLRAHGWSAVESDTSFAVFERLEGEETLGLEVPLRTSAGDYERRLAELLHNLELIERRSQLEIYRDIIHANQDVVRLSVDVPDPGRMGLEEASTLFSATRDLVLAAACSTHTRRAPITALGYGTSSWRKAMPSDLDEIRPAVSFAMKRAIGGASLATFASVASEALAPASVRASVTKAAAITRRRMAWPSELRSRSASFSASFVLA